MSEICTFPRGVHPPEGKELAAECAVEVLPQPSQVRIPLLQHVGAPATSVVKPRTEVKMGEKVGEAGGMISAHVHASLSGKVGRSRKVTLPNGRRVPAVEIAVADEQEVANDKLWEHIYGGEWPTDVSNYEAQAIVDAVREAGLVGMGGAAFPTHVKLMRNPEKPIDTILINGAECEPYLTADYRLMLEAPAPIVCGALLAAQATGAKEVRICIEDNKPQAIAAMQKAVAGTHVKVTTLKTKYPQGGEKQLILAVTGREVPNGGLPLDVGVVVVNAGTAAAIARAVVRQQPVTHRIVTVSGEGIQRPANLLVPIGVAIQELLDYCGGFTSSRVRVIAGGPMMGFAISALDSPVTKGTSGITVFTEQQFARTPETNCIRCGRCVDVCPMGLVPTRIALAARKKDAEVAQRYHVNACMECGCCAYVCPASLPLVQLIRLSKIYVRQAQNR
ncbi:MAG: electron transport complex subunit RsxC [Lentisphaerae bacterium]|nr:MAG: electron transport complex subunit RsxC [Lentisphaerota bacterium]